MRNIHLLTAAAVISLGLIGTISAPAQNEKSTGNTVTVTGCLSQGDEANEYAIKDANGKTYGLFASAGVSMKPHVGHKVTITGTPAAEPSGRKSENVKTGAKEESEHLRVSNLTMVSTSCT